MKNEENLCDELFDDEAVPVPKFGGFATKIQIA